VWRSGIRVPRRTKPVHHPPLLVRSGPAGYAVTDAHPVDVLVVCQGDACAPNTLITDNGACSGHVDLGATGVEDRWPAGRKPAPDAASREANNDTTGAVRAVESIATGLRWRRLREPVTVIGTPEAKDREACWELGATTASSLLP
jgi:hypothetical protein